MGSQALEILRQGVWASLTGGYFYDPHQGVFCNVVHLYLWLYLLCSPFVAYLYFPSTWLTWCIYMLTTTLTIFVVKLANMALHRLYDRAQTMSEANLKNQFFKVTKETEHRGNETGIEMKILGVNGSRNSVEQAINEASEENSMLSIDNVNSIIDLKVDVHRKNSSESIELMFYAPSMLSSSSQQDQQSIAGSASVSKSLRSASGIATTNASTSATTGMVGGNETLSKYLAVYPELAEASGGCDNNDANTGNASGGNTGGGVSNSTHEIGRRQPHLSRKCTDVFNRRHHRRRLERQSSLDAPTDLAPTFVSRLMRNQSDTIATADVAAMGASCGVVPGVNISVRNETFLHSQLHPKSSNSNSNKMTTSRASSGARQYVTTNASGVLSLTQAGTVANGFKPKMLTANSGSGTSTSGTKATTRLQRHRSSETHDERLKHQSRGIFQPIPHEQHHHLHHHHHQLSHTGSGASSIGTLALASGITTDADDIELGLGGSSGIVGESRGRLLQSWILDSSSDVYLEDDGFTKSDLGIEQIEARSSFQQQNKLNFQLPQQFRPQHHHHHHLHHHLEATNIRKDSNSTMSALQLSVVAPSTSSKSNVVAGGESASGSGSSCAIITGNVKRRRHSNATMYYKNNPQSSKCAILGNTQPPGVRRIKSTALEIPCAQPSVSNLCSHPNSVEAIGGQQQMRNPLPPPSKSLVRNQHLNLYPRLVDQVYADSSSTCSSLNFGASSACGSTTALIEPPVYPIVEHSDEKTSLDLTNDELEIEDDKDDDDANMINRHESSNSRSSGRKNLTTKSEGDVSKGGTVDEKIDDSSQSFDNGRDDIRASGKLKPKATLGCNPTHHSAESDVGGILADDDEEVVFKEFDDNLENILSELQQTQNQLDDVLKQVGGTSQEQQHKNNTAASMIVDDDDEETDNNGSRSPLLSVRSRPVTLHEAAADKAMKEEIAATQRQGVASGASQEQQQHQHQKINHNQIIKSEADSGCPSSDCDQISASSKDQLLSGIEPTGKCCSKSAVNNEQASAATSTAAEGTLKVVAKNLGAIPKVIRYQDVNESHNEPGISSAHVHMWRGGRHHDVYPCTTVVLTTATHTLPEYGVVGTKHNKAIASTRTSSSSNSSHSISVENLSADIHKMLWLMHGGAVDERGRPIAGIAADGTPIAAHPNIVPPNMSTAHFQFYQDAIQDAIHALHNPAQSIEHLTHLERTYFRDKLRRDSKQASEPGIDFATQLNGGVSSQVINTSAASTSHQAAIGMLMSSTSALNTRNNNVNNSNNNNNTATTLSLQGLINVIRNERNSGRSVTGMDALSGHVVDVGLNSVGGVDGSVTTASQAAGGSNAGVAILNVDGHHFGPYCDFWRPACLLSAEKPAVPKSFYKYHFKCCGYEREFKISMDRLQLLALFDRDLHWVHIVLSLLLCLSVAYLGASILQHSYYKDVFAFLFCAVIASAQYSLVKSVQPDAASPIHGFNKTVAYSRAIYFTLCASLLLLLKRKCLEYEQQPPTDLTFFGVRYSPLEVATVLLQFMYIVMLCFPLIFSLGLFPQINTFLMYMLEQIDMHIFGGNAASSLLGAFICVLRSIIAILLLYGPLYAALAEDRGTQYIVFSIFCAMLIPLSYHLSRSASDFSHIWRLIKTCIVSTYRDDDDEVSGTSDTNSRKMNTSTTTTKNAKLTKRCAGGGGGDGGVDIDDGLEERDPRDRSTAANSNENIELSSLDKLPMRDCDATMNLERKHSKSKASSLGSSQTLGKTISSSKRAMTASSSFASIGAAEEGIPTAATSEVNELPNEEDVAMQEHETDAAAAAGATAAVSAPLNDDIAAGAGGDNAQNNNNNISNNNNNNNNNNLMHAKEKNEAIDDEIKLDETPPSIGGIETAAIAAVKKTQDFVDESDERISNSSTTNPCDISTLTAGGGVCAGTAADASTNCANTTIGNLTAESKDSDLPDPLPRKLQNTVNTRLKNDIVVMTLLAVSVLGLHCSTVFTVLQPDLNIVLYVFTGALGMLLHYIIPQMRKHMPWLCFARPILRQKEYGQFEVSNAPKIMWFETVYIYLCLIERNVLFPLLAISALTADAQVIANKFGVPWGTLIVAVCALKFVRNAYSDPTNQYLIVLFTVLLFRIDFAVATETFIIDYFFVSLAFRKCCDFLLKLQFIVTYIAPWQITWGSAFHAFAQPFSVPHSAMLFLQAAVSAIFSTPLNPFLGSAIFLTSYVRPIKFWERDYNTRRIDHSNTRLSSQLERDLGADDNNLNSIFYEHLTRSLQHSLCGDLLMGRWGNVNQGDCFVLASDYLNCLVHIIELGNGLCTFQMRGLEFRGTYCQQREVEAITEDVEDNDGCCCCDPGHLPRLLSANAMFSTRWLAWQVVAAQYVLEGYSISDNLASATLQVFEYRKVLITYYIKSIIYYVIKNPKLEQWLAAGPIQDALQTTLSRQFVDLDPIFNFNLDEDFDFRSVGITRSSFCYVYLKWINFCVDKRKDEQNPKETTATTTAGSGLITSASNLPGAMAGGGMGMGMGMSTGTGTGTTDQQSNNQHQTSTSTAETTTTTSTTTTAYNDSKSTPNLSTQNASASQPKSQSQQQLRATRPQKSATMSGSATVNNARSSEHMASSHSFANISRQTSESAPGLSGAGLNMGYVSYMDNSAVFNQTAVSMAHSVKIGAKNQGKTLRREESPRPERCNETMTTTTTPGMGMNMGVGVGIGMTTGGNESARGKPALKLKVASVAKDAPLVSLCLALGLLARRSLATASHSSLTGVEFFLHGLHALFKGDFRITSPRDEWVFADMELLHSVVAPAVKMALKLQQDHISNPDEFLDPNALYEAIDTCSQDLVISHEADPVWRSAVLKGAPNLLALRHVMEDGSDEYRIIRLTKRFLSFRVIKLNRECVRGLWAGQQQELIYLRNRNPERGSIQNAKQALRNIINSSCDQPIGYPIYVSPLTTSYADTNSQLCDIIGGPITLESIKLNFLGWWHRIRERCRQGCSSGSALETSNLGVCNFGSGVGTSSVVGGCGVGVGVVGGVGVGVGVGVVPTGSVGGESGDLAPVFISAPLYNTLTVNNYFGVRSGNVSNIGSSMGGAYVTDSLTVVRGGLAVMPVKPTSTTLIAGLLNRERELERTDAVPLRDVSTLRASGNSGQRKSSSHQIAGARSQERERERRTTLPVANASAAASGSESKESVAGGISGKIASEPCDVDSLNYASTSRHATKISTSSGSLGIGNIITTPGDYPRKTKGPICLTAAALPNESSVGRSIDLGLRKPRIEIFRKVIIVDDTEIYDCLDLIDAVIWPNEHMRANGGRVSWKDWEPSAGMVGYVVHCWIPNHSDPRFRSHVNRILYLIEIGEHYVPVEELGLREYNQIMGSSDEMANSRRSSIQREFDEYNLQLKLAGLTPILGSGLKSASRLLSNTAAQHKGAKPKIQAVSSSSSDDDDDMPLPGVDMKNFNTLLNMWKLIADKKKNSSTASEQLSTDEFEGFDYDNEMPHVVGKPDDLIVPNESAILDNVVPPPPQTTTTIATTTMLEEFVAKQMESNEATKSTVDEETNDESLQEQEHEDDATVNTTPDTMVVEVEQEPEQDESEIVAAATDAEVDVAAATIAVALTPEETAEEMNETIAASVEHCPNEDETVVSETEPEFETMVTAINKEEETETETETDGATNQPRT